MQLPQLECIDSRTEKDFSHYGKFVLKPLYRGQGTTIGSSLKRVLLSNLEGAAVTAVRIAGVSNQFDSIPGVREDTLSILLNFKELVVKSYSSKSLFGRLTATSPATITAAHLELPRELEVINPKQHIATLVKGTLNLEFRVERGKGYHLIGKVSEDTSTSDFLPIDAVFMPVRKVEFSIKELQTLNYSLQEQLTLEIWTNGSLHPQEALNQAANILVDLFNPLKDISLELSNNEDFEPDDPANNIPVEELQLSVRAYNCLKRAQINSVADLLDYTQEGLLEIKNLGQKVAEEIIEALQQRVGITLPYESTISRHRLDFEPSLVEPQQSHDTNQSLETGELDFMTEEVKAQIGRMDEHIAQILTWTQKQIGKVNEDPNLLKLKKLEQENSSLQADLARTQERLKLANEDKTGLGNQINELKRKDSERDEILLLLQEKLHQLTEQYHQQRASLDSSLMEINEALQDKAILTNQAISFQQENSQLQHLYNQAQMQLAQQNQEQAKVGQQNASLVTEVNLLRQNITRLESCITVAETQLDHLSDQQNSLTSQLEALRQENKHLTDQSNNFQNQVALLEQERSQERLQVEQGQNQIDQLIAEKNQLLSLAEQFSEERSGLLDERQTLQNNLIQGNEALQLLQAQLSERSQLLEESTHQLTVLTQNLSPVLQTLNTQLNELKEAESVPETQALLTQLVSQLTSSQEQLQRIRPVALPLLERLRQNEICLQTELDSIQARLNQSQQEKESLQSELDSTILQLRQAHQDLENFSQNRTHLQEQLSAVTEHLQQTQQQFTQAQIEYSQLQLQLNTLEGRLQQTQLQLQHLQKELEQARQERSLNLEIARDREARTIYLLEQLAEKDRDLQQVRQQFDAVSQQNSQYQIELTNLENRLQQTQQELDRVSEQLIKSEEIREGLWDRLTQIDRGAKDWFRGLFGRD